MIPAIAIFFFAIFLGMGLLTLVIFLFVRRRKRG